MSDFTDFENVEEGLEPAIEAEEAEDTPSIAAEQDAVENDDDFFAEDATEDFTPVDPAKVITVRTSSAEDRYIEVEEGRTMPLVDAIAKCGIRFNGDYVCWLNGQEVSLGTQVGGGTVVTVVGSVKGG